MPMVTIKQVAQHAGVSRATVSRVLNHHPRVDPLLREKVLASVAALNYQPNAVARSLRRQETHTIGLIVPDNRNPFFAEIASGIEELCYGAGYSVYLCNSAESEVKEIEYCRSLYQQRVAGVIMSIKGTTAEGIDYLQDKGMPVVLLDRGYPNIDVDWVQCDHRLGAREAMAHLMGFGHRRIGLLLGPHWHPNVRDRLQGCVDVLTQYGCSPEDLRIYETPLESRMSSFEAGYAGAQYLLSQPQPPTAIFAFNDILAIGALRYAWERGIVVPGALSIVGVDDIPLSAFVSPRLTTVAQPLAELGHTAAQLLLDRVQGTPDLSGGCIHRMLQPHLIIRESTGRVNYAATS